MALTCPSVKCFMVMAPVGHVTEHVPHPLQEISFILALTTRGATSTSSMALNSQTSSHLPHPRHKSGLTQAVMASVLIFLLAMSIAARAAAALAETMDSGTSFGPVAAPAKKMPSI